MKHFLTLLIGLVSLPALAAGPIYNVRDYGAVGDGRTLDHEAINRAIDACTTAGGGQVLVPAGTYLCGSIRMKDHVDLHLMHGATILAAPPELRAYDPSEEFGGPEYQDGGHTYTHNSLIWAEDRVDVGITGFGRIDGDGLTRRDTENEGTVLGGSIGTGDKAIAFKRCRGVTIRDITIFRGGHFAIILTGCERGTIDAVTIDTGLPGTPIRNVLLDDIHIRYRGGGTLRPTPYPELGATYPEPRHLGPTPSYGLFARHVVDLRLRDVRFELMAPDERPAILTEDVEEPSR